MSVQNHFELFDLPVCFHPEPAGIRSAYLKLSMMHHPDKVGSDLDEETLALSARVNEANKVLTNKWLRVKYVLSLHDVSIDEGEKLPADFLMEMMEWNERIEEVDSENPTALATMNDHFDQLNNELDGRLEALTRRFDELADRSLLAEIKEICLKHKYLLRLKESIDTFAHR